MTVQSVDGRGKVPGFVDYLQQRQKCAYGRFHPNNARSNTAVCAVAYVQKQQSPKDRLEWRICLDIRTVPNMNLPALTMTAKQHLPSEAAVTARTASTTDNNTNKKGGGIAGEAGWSTISHQRACSRGGRSLQSVAASRFDDQGNDFGPHLSSVIRSQRANLTGWGTFLDERRIIIVIDSGSSAGSIHHPLRGDGAGRVQAKMLDRLLDFDVQEGEELLKVPISLVEYQAGLSPDDKARVTMEILKYMVYEAAEEVNEEWVAYNEPAEFMDEAVIAIYKEGAAPPEVLEEINKGELPDEVRGQQRAIQEERMRQANQKASQRKQQVEMDAHRSWNEDGRDGGDDRDNDGLAALNQNKRDRRTIEDFERQKARKRGRPS